MRSCWYCRIGIGALVVALIALVGYLAGPAIMASSAFLSLVEFVAIAPQTLLNYLLMLAAYGAAYAVDWLCCKIFSVCC